MRTICYPITINHNTPLPPKGESELPLGDAAKPKQEKFTPPTLDQVKSYAISAGLLVNESEKFLDYHLSKGWIVGRTKMKDWKASFRNWCRNAGNFAGGNSQPKNEPRNTVPRGLPQLI